MAVAIAAEVPDINSQIAIHGARSPFYVLFDEQGNMLESLANPFTKVERGVALQAASFLAAKDVTLLVAGGFGPKFVDELDRRSIKYTQKEGQVTDVVSELFARS